MAIKVLKKIALPLLFLLWLSPLWAQEEPRFTQHLTWNKDENALRYEVVVEREGRGGFQRLLREFTNENYIRFSLSSGSYRCQVTPYDYLNRPRGTSDWMGFEIIAAFNPQIDSFSPVSINPDKGTTLEISGRNLISGAGVFLQNLDGSGNTVTPAEIQFLDYGRQVRVVFEKKSLVEGNYTIYVRNPGGLEASKEGLAIAYPPKPVKPVAEAKPVEAPHPKSDEDQPQKIFSMSVNAAWMPLLPLYEGIEKRFERKLQLAGAALRFDMFYTGLEFAHPGAELSASFYYLKSSFGSFSEETNALALVIDLNLLLQKRFFNNKMAVTLRAGAGFAFQKGGLDYEGNELFTMAGKAPHLNAGLSYLWAATDHISVEAGVNFIHSLTKEHSSGYLRPWVGVGWWF